MLIANVRQIVIIEMSNHSHSTKHVDVALKLCFFIIYLSQTHTATILFFTHKSCNFPLARAELQSTIPISPEQTSKVAVMSEWHRDFFVIFVKNLNFTCMHRFFFLLKSQFVIRSNVTTDTTSVWSKLRKRVVECLVRTV